MSEVIIKHSVHFIKETKDEAIQLAQMMGGGEVHELCITKKDFAMPDKPVGYLVLPLNTLIKE